MNRTTTVLVTVSVVGSRLFAGFAGAAAAGDDHDEKTGSSISLSQDADAGVTQDHDGTGVSDSDQNATALSFGGNATVEQTSEETNENVQYGEADAENTVETDGIVIAF